MFRLQPTTFSDMKCPIPSILFAAVLLSPAVVSAQTTPVPDTSGPEVTIDTASVVLSKNAIISGTATDTGSTTTIAGVREVLYQFEGQTKWRRATLTNRGGETTTWLIKTTIKGTRGKRIYFRAVDFANNESDVVGRRFRRGS